LITKEEGEYENSLVAGRAACSAGDIGRNGCADVAVGGAKRDLEPYRPRASCTNVVICPVSAIFALDDLPEKWEHFTEINASYVQGGKFTPEEFAKHSAK
jgi:hypothetical protein